MGENPITKTIKLKESPDDSRYLELKNDGTACYVYVDKSNEKRTEVTFKYSYDGKKETITMIVEKSYYESFVSEAGGLFTYSEVCSKINEDYTVENVRQSEKEYYEEYKDKEKFKEEYPGCDTYKKYEEALLEESGFASFNAYVEYNKQWLKNNYKVGFSAKITYAYKNEDGKLTLTEKFTGVKNLVNSMCHFSDGSNRVRIDCSYASIDYYNDGTYSYYYGNAIDTDNKTISFESRYEEEDGNVNIEKVNATYTEDIDAGTVTIKFKDKEYVCEFEGEKYTQVE